MWSCTARRRWTASSRTSDQPGPLFDWLSNGDVPLDESGPLKVSQTSPALSGAPARVADVDRIWAAARALYRGYRTYPGRTHGRTIRVFLLTTPTNPS